MLKLDAANALTVKALHYAAGYSYGRDGGTVRHSLRAWTDLEGNCWNSGYLRGKADYMRAGAIPVDERTSLRMGRRMAGIGAGLQKGF